VAGVAAGELSHLPIAGADLGAGGETVKVFELDESAVDVDRCGPSLPSEHHRPAELLEPVEALSARAARRARVGSTVGGTADVGAGRREDTVVDRARLLFESGRPVLVGAVRALRVGVLDHPASRSLVVADLICPAFEHCLRLSRRPLQPAALDRDHERGLVPCGAAEVSVEQERDARLQGASGEVVLVGDQPDGLERPELQLAGDKAKVIGKTLGSRAPLPTWPDGHPGEQVTGTASNPSNGVTSEFSTCFASP